MGGDYVPSNDGDSCLEGDFSLLSSDSATFLRDDGSMMVEIGTVSGRSGVNFREYVEKGSRPSGLDFEVRKILQGYDDLKIRCENLKESKEKILSYSPGAWTAKVGGMKLSDHEVPKTTCLILVGPKASGKSSLINRISRVFEDDKFTSARAQVSYNSPIRDGTYFLQEFMIPRDSTSFCLYDTRSFSDDSHENDRIISGWMTKGVRHGEPVVRNTDDQSLRESLKCKARNNDSISTTRQVNFVIYVVSGLSVLKAMESNGDSESQYIETIASTFNSPYLSFKDDKPVLVVTHGDLLSLSDCARVRAHLAEVLGIPPAKQIFDVSGCDDPVTDFTITEMLRYSLEHADKDYPLKSRLMDKVYKATQPSLCMILLNLLLLGVAILLAKDMFIAKQEAPPHYVEPEFPSRQAMEVPSNHAVQPNSPSYQAKHEGSPHYTEPEVSSRQEMEVSSHDSAVLEGTSDHGVKPDFPSYQAKQEVPPHYAEPEVPSCQETEVPSHDSVELEGTSDHAVKPNFPSYQAKQEVPSHFAEPGIPSRQEMEVPSHDSAKHEVPSNAVKPNFPSYQAKQEVPPHYVEPEVPYCREKEVPSHDSAKFEVPKYQAKEGPPHFAEPEVPSYRATEVPSDDAAKPKIACHHGKQSVPPHYSMKMPSHDAAKPKVAKQQEEPKIASHRAKQEVPPHYSEPEVPSSQAAGVPSHDAAKPKVRKHQAKPKIPSHHAKQKVHMTEPKIIWHKIRHLWL